MPTALPLRIAVLECDTPLPATRAQYQSYGGCFAALLRAGAEALQHPGLSSTAGLAMTNFDVVDAQAYPDLDAIDAVLISGSKHNSFDDAPWIRKLVAFTQTVLAHARVRLIGVCFGHQIVGRAMGVKVGRCEEGWETSVTALELTAKGRELFGQADLSLHQMHRDMVFEYPAGVEALAHTERCPVQGMYVPRQLITVQGHPEFTAAIVGEILASRRDMGIFDDAFYQESMSRVAKHHDGVVVSQAFLRFLLE